jgi:hypothetical protein
LKLFGETKRESKGNLNSIEFLFSILILKLFTFQLISCELPDLAITPAQLATFRLVTYKPNSDNSTSGNNSSTLPTNCSFALLNWTAQSSSEANQWRSVTYGNGLYVAVSSTGTNRVMTSTNGVTWTARSASEANQWRSLTYGNGLFVATSIDGINRVMTSPDGITWTARSAPEANLWFSVTMGMEFLLQFRKMALIVL